MDKYLLSEPPSVLSMLDAGEPAERITGPLNGYYLASYACWVPESGQYLGYAKVCVTEPPSYWEAQCCAKFCGDTVAWLPEAALDSAEQIARMQLANLGVFRAVYGAPAPRG
jgi:hypothetical protein